MIARVSHQLRLSLNKNFESAKPINKGFAGSFYVFWYYFGTKKWLIG